MYLVLLSPHGAPIISMCVQIVVEFDILFGNSILTDMWQSKECQGGAEDAERAGDEERILSGTGCVRCIVLNDREDVAANKRSDLANRGGNAVVLASNAGSTCL